MQSCRIGGLAVGGDAPVRLMGVINCSPESFYSGSYVRPSDVLDCARTFVREGAEIIDIGARSTAPRTPPISVPTEKERIIVALKSLEGTGIRISVDTMHPSVLEACTRYDIAAVNDISGLANPAFAANVADTGLPAICMATFREPGDAVGQDETMNALGNVLSRAEQYGIRDVVLDPGIGRWTAARTVSDDWDLCRNFYRFRELNRPLLAAVSRKTFLGELLNRQPADRLAGSLAVTYSLLEQGAAMVRAHDVPETRDIIRVYEMMRGVR
ncbi:MAG: dihydropteroate synthase [Methanoculleus sp. SDB]|nr:MAG: dihydropteroate synthase [Methanoculleus sp. SDB]